VIAARFAAARDLHVEQHFGATGRRGELLQDPLPLAFDVWVRQADRVETVVEPPQVGTEPERPAPVHWNHFVHAVREQEAAIER